jgi:thiamine pyrophosphokinase
MIIKIFTGPLNYTIEKIYKENRGEFIIGVDMACSLLMDKNIPIDLAIGDFDSLREGSMKDVIEYSDKTLIYPTQKDETDTFLAVKEALAMKHTEIRIYGGIGQRFDHSFANLSLLRMGNIMISNDCVSMYLLEPGSYEIESKRKFISFFALEDIKELDLIGFKYQQRQYDLDRDDPLCVSNEGSGIVSFTKGLMLVIEQDE